MDLERLLVLHRTEAAAAARRGTLPDAGARPGFRLTTCQRELAILFHPPADITAATEVFRGVEAYRFLLEFATGLHSAIPGETNVFGQLRASWRDYARAAHPLQTRELAPLIATLCADTREIRTQFLQDIGGHSYGTLTRKVLRPAPGARILVVGHGALARSVLPMLAGFELGLINRTRPAAIPQGVKRVFGAEEAATALDWTDHVVLCIPRDPDLDARWIRLLASHHGKRAVHLGCRRSDPGAWAELPGLVTLDDLFELRLAQQGRRARQLELARAACAERARWRARQAVEGRQGIA